jgi:hypothetical protein
MTTDMENELRDLFREKAGEAPIATPASAPQRVLRRGRRRQVGTVLGSAGVALLLIVGSVAGLQRILGDDRDTFETGEYEVFERTATIEAFTVTSPSNWFLVNQWPRSMQSPFATGDLCPEGNPTQEVDCIAPADPLELDPSLGLPMVQLSNKDIGLASTACGQKLGADTATLYLALDHERDAANIYPPYLADPGERELPPQGDGPCGPGRYASFSVSGQPFFAWIGMGDGVDEADRASVLDAFESLVVDDWQPSERGSEGQTPAYVVAGGVTDKGQDWRLELRPGRDAELALVWMGSMGRFDVSIDEEPVSWCCRSRTEPSGVGSIVTFGGVRRGTTGVEFRPSNGADPIAGTILPLPPTMPFDFDLFFIEGAEGLRGEVVALGLADEASDPPPVAVPRGDEVELAGNMFGQRYRVRFIGSFEDDTACIRITLGGERSEPLCPRPLATSLAGTQPSMHGVTTKKLNLLVGAVPPEVVEIRFTSDDGTDPPTQFQCQMGPIGWTDPDRRVCVIALPAEGSGIFEYLDSDGDALFEEGMGWGASAPTVVEPLPVDPVQGGTYWAVYAWLGSGDQEAQIEEAQRYLENRGVQGLRGSLSCDEGAAEALGTSADHKVAVYFETQQEANTFALNAGLLGHEADPMIARVTTVCLD